MWRSAGDELKKRTKVLFTEEDVKYCYLAPANIVGRQP
jgi:hypothetical protein